MRTSLGWLTDWLHLVIAGCVFAACVASVCSLPAQAEEPQPFSPASNITVRPLEAVGKQLAFDAQSKSRIVSAQRIASIKIHDPHVVTLQALSPTEIEFSAKQPGATQVTFCTEQNEVHEFELVAQPCSMQIEDLTDQPLQLNSNSSRRLVGKERIVEVHVTHPEVIDITPLSPTELQVSTKKAGVTQITLYSEQKQVNTFTVIVLGDAEELAAVLKTHFPKVNTEVTPVANNVVISGTVNDPAEVTLIMRVAGEYFPTAVCDIRVCGVAETPKPSTETTPQLDWDQYMVSGIVVPDEKK